MTPKEITKHLELNAKIFEALFDSVSESMIDWRPDADKWSFLEVVCHLLDEEREDFRARISSLFRDPKLAFESIDPEGWVKTRYYSEQDYHSVCKGFLEERKRSIEWLNLNLDQDWSLAFDHSHFGPMSAIYLLNNWLAHDLLHVNQWNRMTYRYFRQLGMNLNYAGPDL